MRADLKSSSRQGDILEELCEEERKKEEKEALEKLTALLERLPPREREVIRLKEIEGLKPGQIACKLNMRPATVRQCLYRAMKQLRKWFHEGGM